MEKEARQKPKSLIEIKIKTSTEETAPFHQKALTKIAQKTKLPGFRPGHAPLSLVEANVGHDHIDEEMVNLAIPPLLQFALKDSDYNPLVWPKAIIESVEPLVITFTFPIRPKVEVKDWENLLKNNLQIDRPNQTGSPDQPGTQPKGNLEEKILETLVEKIEIKDLPEVVEKAPDQKQIKLQWILEELAKSMDKKLETKEDFDYIMGKLKEAIEEK